MKRQKEYEKIIVMNQRGSVLLYILVGLLLLVLVGAGAYHLGTKTNQPLPQPSTATAPPLGQTTQSASPTGLVTNLQIYTNNLLGFSFQYPNTWRFTEDLKLENGGTVQLFNYPVNKYQGGEMLASGDVKIEIAALSNPNHIDLLAFIKQSSQGGLNANKEHTNGNLPLGSFSAITDEVQNDPSYRSYYVQLQSDKVLVVTVFPAIGNNESRTILSTFTN